MAEYKITIDINEQTKDTASIGSNNNKTSPALKVSTKTAANAAIALSAGKKLLQFGLSSIEMYTGNSALQTQVNNTMQAVGIGIGMVTNPVATLAMLGVNAVTQALTRKNEIMWGNKQAERLQRRGGLYLSATQR